MNKLKNFAVTFLILFSLSPFVYAYISISKKDKRTDYPGKEIAKKVQKTWNEKYNSEISFVSGNEWVAGNLSYHLKSRPKWIGYKKDESLKNRLSMVDVYVDEINEAILKVGYFNVYGKNE